MWGLIFVAGPKLRWKLLNMSWKSATSILFWQCTIYEYHSILLISSQIEPTLWLFCIRSCEAWRPDIPSCMCRCICSWRTCSKSLQRSIAFAPWKRMEQCHEQQKKRGEDGWEELRGEGHQHWRWGSTESTASTVHGYTARHLGVPAEVLTWGEPQCGGDSRAVRGQLHDAKIRKERTKWWTKWWKWWL